MGKPVATPVPATIHDTPILNHTWTPRVLPSSVINTSTGLSGHPGGTVVKSTNLTNRGLSDESLNCLWQTDDEKFRR